jgi:peptidoglycan/LPS O-acetylase OafA/YrhL
VSITATEGQIAVREDGASRRVNVVDALRGIASLAVCWYHLVWADHAFAGGGIVAAALRASARDDWMGVEIFFVISGFVIPLALYRARYRVQGYGTFMLKRLVRLEPPYLVSVILCVVLWYVWAVVPRLHGPAFTLSFSALALHLGYLNAYVHQGWLNPVYWTLAIEFQYYIGMGVLFLLIANRRAEIRAAVLVGLGALAFLFPSTGYVFHYLFVFMLGMVTFQHSAGLITTRLYLVSLALVGAGCWLTLGSMVAVLAVATALCITFVRRDFRVLGFLGAISYSLYLIHVPVGGRILDLGLAHTHGGIERVLWLGISVAATVGAATLLHRYVERPAQRWSSRIRYRETGTAQERRSLEPIPATVAGIAEP